jgi:uncharacterized membrane protein
MSTNVPRNWLLASTILVGLFAGVLFAASLAISPSLGLLDASHYTLVKQAQIRILQVSMAAISTLYTITAAYALLRMRHLKEQPAFRLTAAALILILLALGYSAFTDIPYNQQILSWNPANPPANWADVRHAWDVANLLRTIPSVLGFILQAASLMQGRAGAAVSVRPVTCCGAWPG